MRLKERLDEAGFSGFWTMEAGHIVRLGKSRQLFFSADTSAHVVGATAHILLEVDEAQDVDRDKFYKEFRPMGASTNVTTVLYGTPWNDSTLLEEMGKQRSRMMKACLPLRCIASGARLPLLLGSQRKCGPSQD